LGGKAVIVKLIKGNDSASDIVINGKAMLGIANDAIIEVANKALAENRIVEPTRTDPRPGPACAWVVPLVCNFFNVTTRYFNHF